jgi:hypothetical protein
MFDAPIDAQGATAHQRQRRSLGDPKPFEHRIIELDANHPFALAASPRSSAAIARLHALDANHPFALAASASKLRCCR